MKFLIAYRLPGKRKPIVREEFESPDPETPQPNFTPALIHSYEICRHIASIVNTPRPESGRRRIPKHERIAWSEVERRVTACYVSGHKVAYLD